MLCNSEIILAWRHLTKHFSSLFLHLSVLFWAFPPPQALGFIASPSKTLRSKYGHVASLPGNQPSPPFSALDL
eukprot:2620625-Amphidinium_carterae.1